MPAKLKEMQALFLSEAAKYQVLPLDNTGFIRLLTSRPSATAGMTTFSYVGPNPGIPVGNAPSILDRDYTMTAEVTIPSGGAEGMIATLGGRFGGYGLYMSRSFNWWFHEAWFRRFGLVIGVIGLFFMWLGGKRQWGKWGKRFGTGTTGLGVAVFLLVWLTGAIGFGAGKPTFTYNFLDLVRTTWSGPSLSAGKHTIVFDFKYDGPRPAKGGTGVLTVDGKEVDRKTMEHTIPLLMSIDETMNIGSDTRSGVDDFEYELPFIFTGTIDKFTVKLGPSQLEEPAKKATVPASEPNS